jgi:biopolymer transport protein ExbD
MHKIGAFTNTIFEKPQIQIIPLIDIMFFALIFFMVLSVYYRVESQMDIKIPESSQSRMSDHTKTETTINIDTSGTFVVNGRKLNEEELNNLLQKASSNQNVIIRADKKTYHQDVIKVLDICARNNIQDVSFATQANQP